MVNHKCRAFMVAEAMIGMAVMTIVFGVLVVSIHSQHRFAEKMADDRDDLRRVRAALFDLQAHRTIAPMFAVQALPTPAPTGWQWVDVRLHQVTLSGLTPITPKAQS